MKACLLIFAILSHTAFAQMDLPELSPSGFIRQTVGYTEFEIRYGRPAARQRKIIGDLVPYKKLWRTGAGKCSTISFDHDVAINGKTVPAGIYAIVTIPDKSEWTVMLNRDTSELYGDPSEYDPANEVVQLKVKPGQTSRFYESLTFDLDIQKYDAILYLSWEDTQIHLPIVTGSHERALATIDTTLKNNPHDTEALAQASFYYFMNNESPQQILKWLDEAIARGGDRWVYSQKVDVLVRMGKYTEARQAANQGVEYLKRTKPQEWDTSILNYEAQMKSWPKN